MLERVLGPTGRHAALALFFSFCNGSLNVSDIVRCATSMSLLLATLGRLAASQSQK